MLQAEAPKDAPIGDCIATLMILEQSPVPLMTVQNVTVSVVEPFDNSFRKRYNLTHYKVTEDSPVIIKSDFSAEGKMSLSFSKQVQLPDGITGLTSENEGPEVFNITLIVHELNRREL